jgi:poly-gamma-glutamate synthesis protein (capsule biosynthesis protein)
VESAARPGKPGIAPIEVGFSFEPDINLMVEQPGTMPAVHTWASPRDQQLVCERVAALCDEGRTVIVGIHWGVPEKWMSPAFDRLAEYQRPLGHALVDAGAAVVFGHHSHSLHPIEVYRGRPIFYSAGNFLFEDPRSFMAPESVIVQASLGPRLGVTLVPAVLDADGFPRLATGGEARRVLAWLEELSAGFGTVLAIEGDRARLVLGAV